MILPQGKRGKMAMDNSNKDTYNGIERRSTVADNQDIITNRELIELSIMVKQIIVKLNDLSDEFKHYKRDHDEEDGAKNANSERLYRKLDTDVSLIRNDVKVLMDWKAKIEDQKKNGDFAKIRNQIIMVGTTVLTTMGVTWLIAQIGG